MLLPCHIQFSHVYWNVWSALDSCHIFRIKFHYAVLLLSWFTCDLSSSRNTANYNCSSKMGRLVSQDREDWIVQALGAADANSFSAQTSFFLLTGGVKSFAQDDMPSLVLHVLWRLDPLLFGREVASLSAMGSIMGRHRRMVFKRFAWTVK